MRSNPDMPVSRSRSNSTRPPSARAGAIRRTTGIFCSIADTRITGAATVALMTRNARGMIITRNVIDGAGDNGDADNFLTPQFACASVQSGLNFARYCDPQLDQLISEGKAASAQAQRSELYRQAQTLIQQQALWLPLAHPTAFALHSDRVSGYQVSPFGRQDFAKVRLN